MMMAFGGTNQKCRACEETVYLVDKLTADSRIYHKSCFRCHHCRGTLKLSNFNSFEGVLYYRPHFDQLLKRTGGSLDKSFEGCRGWKCIPQELFQMHLWWMCYKPIQLHCSRGKTILLAPPYSAIQGERQLQSA
ncbi:LIM domain-containing protein WLIM1-like [Macadamia integrifolia]|uniref:LIM domain-containing protein WLIM1-like n=1 Tax=Macadamia integrifolia TaxID=60698 RepID=UPI001C4F4091|nr:LIM domain-containing protein WLIM1-like [Macadamia integrifolia]